MPRRARDDLEGYWYHVISRGQRKNPLFFSDEDKDRYLFILNKLLKKYNIILGAYVLMNNHVHLLLFRGKTSLYKFMHILNTKYAQYFNEKYGVIGHVFQDRYISKIILDERHCSIVVNYIHENPHRANISKDGKYKYSSESFYNNNDKPQIKIKKITLLRSSVYSKGYNDLLHNNYIGNPSEYLKIEKRSRKKSKVKYKERRLPNDIQKDFFTSTNFTEEDLEEIRSSNRERIISEKRKYAIKKLYQMSYSLSEIARFLNRTPSGITKNLKLLGLNRYKK